MGRKAPRVTKWGVKNETMELVVGEEIADGGGERC